LAELLFFYEELVEFEEFDEFLEKLGIFEVFFFNVELDVLDSFLGAN
jgi:hypothetical protein